MSFFKRDDFEVIEVSDKHIRLRTVLFVMAFVIAVGSIGFGVSRIGHKDPGFYVITPSADEEALLYHNGVTFSYFCEGSSGDIKAQIRELTEIYSGSLQRAYKLLDAKQTYLGLVNLASVNESLGQDISLPEALYDVLLDAWEKTLEEQGYNMFAGALLREWEEIRMLTEPEAYDPVNDPDMGERIRKLREATADLSHFDVKVVNREEHILRITVDQDYLALLKALEYEGPVLDLGQLHDAYEMEYVKRDLEASGFTKGTLLTDSGLTVNLSGQDQGDFALYSLEKDSGAVVLKDRIKAGNGSVLSFFRCFAMDREGQKEPGYYAFRAKDGSMVWRYENMPLMAEDPGKIQASWCVGYMPATGADPLFSDSTDSGRITDCVYANIRLWSAEDPSAVAAEYRADPVLRWDGRQDG